MATSMVFSSFGWADHDEMKRSWGWFFAMGAILIVLGLVAISFSFVATLASVVAFGWLLVFSGAVQVTHAFWRERRWSGFFVDLFAGVLSLVVGFMFLANPLVGAKTLTLLIAMFLFIGGVERVIVSLTSDFHHRVWLFLNGAIDVMLGVMIWREWPLTGLWVIGLFVGIDKLLSGWSMVMHGVAAKALPEQAG